MFVKLRVACGQPHCDAEQGKVKGEEGMWGRTGQGLAQGPQEALPSPQTTGQSAKHAGPGEAGSPGFKYWLCHLLAPSQLLQASASSSTKGRKKNHIFQGHCED